MALHMKLTPYIGIFIGILVMVQFLLWNIFVPAFEANEEPNYYQQVYYLAHTGTLPNLMYPPQDAGVITYPPGYYVLLIPIVKLIDPSPIYDTSLIREPVTPTHEFRHDFFNRYFHTKDELAFKWNRQQWAVHLMRLVSSLLGLLTIYFVYKSARLFFALHVELAYLAAVMVGFNPMFTHIHATVIVSPLLIFSVSWLLFLLLRKNGMMTKKELVLLGALVGIATITKVTGLFFLGVVFWGIYILPAKRPAFLQLLMGMVFVFLGLSLTAGWFFGRNMLLYGNFLAIPQVVALTGDPATQMIATQGWWHYWEGFMTSNYATFWTGYGWSAVYWPKAVLGGVLLLLAMAVWGWLRVLPTLSLSSRRHVWFLGGTFVTYMLLLVYVHVHFPTFHAKEMYPIIIPITMLMVMGWEGFFRLHQWLSMRMIFLGAGIWFSINTWYLLSVVGPRLGGLFF